MLVSRFFKCHQEANLYKSILRNSTKISFANKIVLQEEKEVEENNILWWLLCLHSLQYGRKKCYTLVLTMNFSSVAAGVAYLSNTSLSLALHRYSTASTHPLQSCTYPWSGNSCEPGICESPGASWRSRKPKYYLSWYSSVRSNFFLCQVLCEIVQGSRMLFKEIKTFFALLIQPALFCEVPGMISISVTVHW